MTNCKLIERNLIDFLDGNLSPELMKQMSEHIESCPACRELAQSFASVWKSADQPDEIELPSRFWASIQSDIDEIDSRRESKSIFGRIIPILQPIAAAAAVVVVVLLGNSFGKVPATVSQSTSEAVGLWDEYELDAFDQFPSGSMVDLYFNTDIGVGDQS
ncbi:MAG: zf-HC2 domain-containing protein [candidate division Zixibacteria bacterium]|nr:zf-HC2 domain-containing protein [candidate division Zixibacteria bacterium]MBU1472067.1 zf-HC2 domain-containing protein [candidate division Zixibacteria bacterium]MBU2623939.1 zf-HC2 domain-containing protein [candidate division Zixibacteria bacterium]